MFFINKWIIEYLKKKFIMKDDYNRFRSIIEKDNNRLSREIEGLRRELKKND